MNKYIVGFIIASTYDEIYIEANTTEQAEKIARIQVRWGLKKRGKCEIMSVRKEGEPDPFLKKLDNYKE